MNIKKLVYNHAVSLMLVLPNLGIAAIVQYLSLIVFHLTGYQAFLLYFVGAGLGFEWGILFAMFSKSNFRVGKWAYYYSTQKPLTAEPKESD